MPDDQQCHLCREPLTGETEEELGRNAIEHFRLFHPDMQETIRQAADKYLEHQFEQLRPEDFGA